MGRYLRKNVCYSAALKLTWIGGLSISVFSFNENSNHYFGQRFYRGKGIPTTCFDWLNLLKSENFLKKFFRLKRLFFPLVFLVQK